jgi:hypothetical protein
MGAMLKPRTAFPKRQQKKNCDFSFPSVTAFPHPMELCIVRQIKWAGRPSVVGLIRHSDYGPFVYGVLKT